MVKTLSNELAEPKKSGVKVGGNNKAKRDKSEIDEGEVDGGKVEDNEVEKKVQKTSKFKNLSKSKTVGSSDFLIPRAKLAFTQLRQAFLKTLIFHHFNPERHIRI